MQVGLRLEGIKYANQKAVVELKAVSGELGECEEM
jgi:hypothetical protein